MNSVTKIIIPMGSGIRRLVAFIAIAFTLSGCMGDQCIDADDFGFPRFTVSARYDPSEIIGTGENEVAPWRDNKLTVNGQPLTIVVKNWSYVTDLNTVGDVSAWSPWYGHSSDGGTAGSALSDINKRFVECTWNGNAGGYGHYNNPVTKYAMITNSPCLLHKGVGLYTLITTQGTDPNAIVGSPPQGITFHVGNPGWQAAGGYQLFDVNTLGQVYPAGGLVYNYSGNDSTTYANGGLYFKILDKVHGDNSGQYRVVIKSGINDPYPDPFQYITALIKAQFFGDPNNTTNTTGVVKNIYLQVIHNPDYKMFVSAFLTLYIMFTAFSFLIGTLEITQTELITRVLKVGIVAALLDPNYGWTFFYNYLFVFFIDGTSELITLIQQAANTGGGSSSLLTMLIAPETIGKVLSLLLTSPTGIIYIIVYMVLLVFYVFISFRAAALYISALIMIGMIIIMGPIFLCFMLFEFTKSLFENWLKQLMYYTLQPIILIASIAFMSMMIRHEIYATLGFRICRWDFPDLGPLFALVNPSDSSSSGTPTSLFFWFFPSPMIGSDFSDTMAVIPVPEAHTVTVNNATISTTSQAGLVSSQGVEIGYQCQAYECNELRYVDLPFLDPGVPHDMDRRNNFRTGTFTQFENLIYIAILLYLMHRFNETAISISKALNNVSANNASPEGAAEAAAHGISDPIQKKVKTATHEATAPIRKAVRQLAFQVENATTGKLSRWWDEKKTNSVAEDALGKGAQQSVLDRVKNNHNLDRNNLNPTAKKDYQDAVSKKLQELRPELSAEKANAIVGNALTRQKEKENATWRRDHSENAVKDLMAHAIAGFDKKPPATFGQLNAAEQKAVTDLLNKPIDTNPGVSKENLAQKKFGKPLKDLTDEQRSQVGIKSLADLAKDAKRVEEFQAAYVQEFQAMSEEGHGMLGKRSSAFRSYTEYNKKLKEPGTGFFSDARQNARGESLHSGYDSLKRALSGGLLEGDTMQYNFDNKRMQTYQEETAEKYRGFEKKALNKVIDNETAANGRDILRPEYLATLKPDIRKKYEALRDKQIEYDVHATLAQDHDDGEAPALMGDRYMKEKMTDTQFRKAIDKAEALRKEHVANDKYLRNQDYKGKEDAASKAMQQREDAINAEFKRNIDLLNKHRKNAGMANYNPKP